MQTVKRGAVNGCGWSGKILKVDLTHSKVWEEDLSEDLASGYTGGAGINARLLYEMMRNNIQADPLSPEDPLIFGFGILVGTVFPCTSRMTITAKSPLTGIFGDSNGGGTFPAKVKQAGYDHTRERRRRRVAPSRARAGEQKPGLRVRRAPPQQPGERGLGALEPKPAHVRRVG